MPMSPRLLRPISTTHPEAQAWRNAVIANGGTVSGSTLNAVSKFCRSIDAAGIRDRLYRLNLFAGTGLNACLVPLYRGRSRTGTQFGNATDTNVGPFVSEDYAETGATGGLTGNGSSKYLDTGFAMNTLPSSTSGHVSVYNNNRSASNSFRGLAGVNVGGSGGFGLSLDSNLYGVWGAFANAASTANGFFLATRNSTTDLATYVNGSSIATNTNSVTPTASALLMAIFANRTGASALSSYNSGRLQMYSVGEGLSAAQVTSFNTAVSAFQTALSRA